MPEEVLEPAADNDGALQQVDVIPAQVAGFGDRAGFA
jgi:hypothetical protein